MRIVTLECPDCGTYVAGNVLEDRRVMKCPGYGCENVLRFDSLPEEYREHLVANRTQYRID